MNKCRAYLCKRTIATQYLMCRDHWFKVPPDIRRAIFDTVPRVGKLPSVAYARNVRKAIEAVKAIEYPPAADNSNEGSHNADN